MFAPKYIFPILCLFYTGCASSPGVYEQTQDSLSVTLDEMYQAALNHDSDKLYHYLSKTSRTQYTESEFRSYFIQNEDYIIEYLGKMRDESKIQPYTIHALHTGDPCGSLSLTLSKDNQWRLVQTPDKSATDDEATRKYQLIHAIKSQRFVKLINEYSLHHPEIAPEKVRELIRLLVHVNENHLLFDGPTAILSVDENDKIYMICTKEGWLIRQIIL